MLSPVCRNELGPPWAASGCTRLQASRSPPWRRSQHHGGSTEDKARGPGEGGGFLLWPPEEFLQAAVGGEVAVNSGSLKLIIYLGGGGKEAERRPAVGADCLCVWPCPWRGVAGKEAWAEERGAEDSSVGAIMLCPIIRSNLCRSPGRRLALSFLRVPEYPQLLPDSLIVPSYDNLEEWP